MICSFAIGVWPHSYQTNQSIETKNKGLMLIYMYTILSFICLYIFVSIQLVVRFTHTNHYFILYNTIMQLFTKSQVYSCISFRIKAVKHIQRLRGKSKKIKRIFSNKMTLIQNRMLLKRHHMSFPNMLTVFSR